MSAKLFVGNLSHDTTGEDLRALFGESGQVESCSVITDRDTGRSKGFGFVEMATDAEAANAISKFNGAEYDGRAMTVNEARPMAPRENRGGRDRDFGGAGRRGSRY